MASFDSNNYQFIDEYCGEKTCFLGQYTKCIKKHNIMQRKLITETEEMEDREETGENFVKEKDNHIDDHSVAHIFETAISNDVSEQEIEFVENGLQQNSKFVSILDDLAGSESENESENESEQPNIFDSIVIDSDDEDDNSADLSPILAELGHFAAKIQMYDTSDILLSDLEFESSLLDRVSILIDGIKKKNSIGHYGGYDICLDDLECLKPDKWFNDIIVNMGFTLIQEKSAINGLDLDIVPSQWFSTYQVSEFYPNADNVRSKILMQYF